MAALDLYRARRDFAATPEPKGRKARPTGPQGLFVVQKHAASTLHYDFRLEMDGVLKSWAVTRGPSLVPAQKRLAVHVEDHPLAYGGFEGTIPAGQYGAGDVIIWDRGTWTPLGDPHEGYQTGRLDFVLDGAKLKGRWHLVRMAPRGGTARDNWLLIKGDDAFARPPDAPDILDEQPFSVVSGRDVEAPPRRRIRGKAARGTPGATRRSASMDEAPPPPAAAAAPPGRARLTHPDRLYWPDAGLTKADLADYYATAWDAMAPFVTARPLALVRCPEGIEGPRFFQKHPWKGIGRAVLPVPDPKAAGEEAPYLAIRGLDGLLALVQGAALEIHPFGSTVSDWEHPDILIMDLDPGEGVAWPAVIACAREIRARLEQAGLAAFVKTSGGKGLHVCAPLAPKADWARLKAFTRQMAQEMAADSPARYVATIAKARRRGRILIDFLRNQRGQTAVAPYSTRARPGAPVSMPVGWDALGEDIGSQHFTVLNTKAHLAARGRDPWADFRAAAVPLPEG